MPKIKVLLLSHSLSLSGAPKVIIDAFEELTEHVSLTTLSLAAGPLAERCRSLGPLTVLPYLPEGNSLPRRAYRSIVAASIKRISREVRHGSPDLIYANTVGALPMVKMLDLPNVPVILHVHELDTVIREYTQDCPELLLHWPTTYIADSEAVRSTLVEKYGIERAKIALVYEFVPDAKIQSLPTASKSPGKRPFVVGSAGFPNWRKGPILWLQMAAELVKIMGPDQVRFVWVGVPDNQDGFVFRAMAEKLGLTAFVEFVPVTPDPWKHFMTFDVFTVTSWEEPFSIVMAENMALKTPGLCFAGCGGTPEVIGDTGMVIPDFSPRAMAESIALLSQSPERMQALGEAARQRVLTQFTSSKQVPKILDVIRSVSSSVSFRNKKAAI